MRKIHVFLTEDHTLVREGFKSLISQSANIEIVGEADSGKALTRSEVLDKADVLLLDIGLPDVSGIELCRNLTKSHPTLRIIMLTANIQEENIIQSVQAGASGFLPKDCTADELHLAIKTVFEGDNYFGKSISQTVYNSYTRSIQNSQQNPIVLSGREQQVLKLIAEGLSHKEIAEELFISVRTVESHKQNIAEKLQLSGTADFVKYAIRHKFIEL